MKKLVLKIDWARHFPPGFEWQHEKTLFIVFLSFSCTWSLGFIRRYTGWLNSLEGIVPEYAAFYELLDKAFLYFPISILFMLAAIALHYAHHHSGSKSIYLMRRLPNKWELHRRCITMPAAAILITISVAVILFFIYYAVYMTFTPDEWLRPNQLEQLLKNWSVM